VPKSSSTPSLNLSLPVTSSRVVPLRTSGPKLPSLSKCGLLVSRFLQTLNNVNAEWCRQRTSYDGHHGWFQLHRNGYGLLDDDNLAFANNGDGTDGRIKLEIWLRNDIVFVINLYVVLGVDRVELGYSHGIRLRPTTRQPRCSLSELGIASCMLDDVKGLQANWKSWAHVGCFACFRTVPKVRHDILPHRNIKHLSRSTFIELQFQRIRHRLRSNHSTYG